MKTYRLSPGGRRLLLALLIGALLIWLFAIWSFVNTLGIRFAPALLLPSLRTVLDAGLGIAQIVPALLMLVLIVANPFVIWYLLAEWSATYTVSEDGLRFVALGVQVQLPWDMISALQFADDDRDDPIDEVLFVRDPFDQITQPLVRMLYRQSFGFHRLPIYPGVADRAELIETIRRYIHSEAA